MRITIYFFCLFFQSAVCVAQYNQVGHFTLAEGLPSNTTYMSVEDHQGFLWIATDQGVARFDGTHFRIFTKRNGVPDNEVFSVIKENNGKIWISCLNNSIAYFDTAQNKFINVTDRVSNSIHGKKMIYALHGNGIQINDNAGSYIFKNDSVYKFPLTKETDSSCLLQVLHDDETLRYGSVKRDISADEVFLYHIKQDHIKEKKSLGIPASYNVTRDGDRLYAFQNKGKQVFIFSQFASGPLSFVKDSIYLPQNYYWHSFTKNHLVILYKDGSAIMYDKNDFKIKHSLQINCLVFHVMHDDKDNFWISSGLNGIFLYRKRKISQISFPDEKTNHSFLSVTKNSNGSLLAGNYSGETKEMRNGRFTVHHLPKTENTDWQRHIIISQHKVFTFGERGVFVNYIKELSRTNNACKIAYTLNDSVIICGYNDGICLLNTKNESLQELDHKSSYIRGIASIDGEKIYYGTREGLFSYHLKNKNCDSLLNRDPRLKDRIKTLCATEDHLLWVGTATNGIYVLKNDRIIFHITEETGLITNSIQTLAIGRKGQIWVGSNKGISIIHYYNTKPFIQNLSVKDGLTSNAINQMYYANDTIYVATENGISVIPSQISVPEFDIPVRLVGVKITNIDTVLLHHYSLKENQNNIIIEIAGVELSGHFGNMEYSIDQGKSWIYLYGNTLGFQRGSGIHHVWVRAVDVNGHRGTGILKLQFDIATPFYKSWQFWLPVALLILCLAIYTNTKLTQKKQQQRIRELLNKQSLDELEMQALKSQMNPHFVFNCLNSIKVFIYTGDLEKAEMYLDKFSIILRNTLDYSSLPAISLEAELAYLDNYLSLEKLRFGEKFVYTIQMASDINTSQINIPALLLQPYLENAIKHGIANLKKVQGKIYISGNIEGDTLHVTIDDNGIGRERATEIKLSKKEQHESKGMHITERRASLYHITQKIIDKKDEAGNATGTCIHLYIPLS